jgi:transposase-like protein
MPEELRKYKINEYLESLTVKEYKAGIKLIPRLLNVSANTIYNWRDIKMSDREDIPAQKAKMLEQLFGMRQGELANYEIDIKSLKQIIREEHESMEQLSEFV